MQSIVIKWDAGRHYGFLENPVLFERDIFVHQRGLVNRQRLIPGEVVEFDLTTNDKGKVAVNVVVIKEAVPALPASATQPARSVAENPSMKETANESAKQ